MNKKEQSTSSEPILNTNSRELDLNNETLITENEALAEIDISEKQRVTELEEEIRHLQNVLRDTQMRAQAEVENIRRRAKIDIEKAHKFSLEKFVSELLPVIDSLERALEVINTNSIESSSVSIITGIELTQKSLLDTVYKFGVEVIKDKNIPFNPDIHQAMSVIESEDVEPNYVLSVMQHGYILNGRLLRPAMVVVAKAKN